MKKRVINLDGKTGKLVLNPYVTYNCNHQNLQADMNPKKSFDSIPSVPSSPHVDKQRKPEKPPSQNPGRRPSALARYFGCFGQRQFSAVKSDKDKNRVGIGCARSSSSPATYGYCPSPTSADHHEENIKSATSYCRNSSSHCTIKLVNKFSACQLLVLKTLSKELDFCIEHVL